MPENEIRVGQLPSSETPQGSVPELLGTKPFVFYALADDRGKTHVR